MKANEYEEIQDKMQLLSADIYGAFLDYTLDPEDTGLNACFRVAHYLDTYGLKWYQINMALEVARELFICG